MSFWSDLFGSIFGKPKPKPPVPPPAEPEFLEARLSTWLDGVLTFTNAVLVLDLAPETPIVGIPDTVDKGRVLFKVPYKFRETGAQVTISADGYRVWSDRRLVTANMDDVVLVPIPKHFDPSGISLEELAMIRGGMWTKMPFNMPATLVVPPGGQPRAHDIAATDFLWNYTDEERLRMVTYLADECKYSHCEVGPVVDSDGYHGTWQPRNWIESPAAWDAWMDMHQYLWDHKLAPVSFIVPDGWSLERAKREITPYLLTERAQKLIRIAVIAWEPGGDYTWSSYTWAGFAQWLGECLPNALILMHNAAKGDGSAPDGPVGGDAAGTDENNDPQHEGANNVGIGWQRVAPHIHGWLIQTGNYSGPITKAYKDNVPLNAEEWGAMFRSDNVGAAYHSINWHLVHGVSAWPTYSKWPDRRPVML